MLKKRQRLTKRAFEVSFKRGRRYHFPELQLIHDTTDPTFHGAAVVGKKVYKKAVDRNRLRRQLYGVLYRLHQHQSLTGTYILIAKPAIRSLPRTQIVPLVTKLISKPPH